MPADGLYRYGHLLHKSQHHATIVKCHSVDSCIAFNGKIAEEKIQYVPMDIQNEKSRKDTTSSENIESIIWNSCPEGLACFVVK